MTRLRRLQGLLVALALASLLTAVVVLVEWLHAPDVAPLAATADDVGDPRVEVDCPDTAPELIAAADAPLVSSDQLLACPDLWDGRDVTFRGEVVGARVERAPWTWLQLNDDVYGRLGAAPSAQLAGPNTGVGVRVPSKLAGAVAAVGGPGRHGDVLEVTGVFHRIDDAAEVAVIHAHTGAVVRRGGRWEQNVPLERWVLLAALATTAAALLVAQRRST